jgi:hypothetical protein
MRWILLICVLTLIASGCAGGPTAPTTAPAPVPTPAPVSTPIPTTRGNLIMVYMILNDAGQGGHGDWQYKVTVHLTETSGVATAVTNIQFQALFASNILATGTVVPVLPISANSSSDASLIFSTDTHVGDLSAVTVQMTVQFRDANGNIGSVSNSFTCFGCPE